MAGIASNPTYGLATDYLPKTITATVMGEEEIITLTWQKATEKLTLGGEYIFSASLPEGYSMQDGGTTLTLEVYAEGWGTDTMPENIGWDQEHAVYTIDNQADYPKFGSYGSNRLIRLNDSDKVILNLTDTKWDAYYNGSSSSFAGYVTQLFSILGNEVTLQGRKDVCYVNAGFSVTRPGETTIYLKDYELVPEKESTMNLANLYNQPQIVTIVYEGTCRLPWVRTESTVEKKIIFKPKDNDSILYIKNFDGDVVEFDGGEVFVEEEVLANHITIKNRCKLTVEGEKAQGIHIKHKSISEMPAQLGNGYQTGGTIIIDDSDVSIKIPATATKTQGAALGGLMQPQYGTQWYYCLSKGWITSKISIIDSNVTIDTKENVCGGMGTVENIEIINSNIVADTSGYDKYYDYAASIGILFRNIIIKNSEIDAASDKATAIGTGDMGEVGGVEVYGAETPVLTITLEDSNIKASSRESAAIGTKYIANYAAGYRPQQMHIYIIGKSKVEARSINGAAIGGGRTDKAAVKDPDSVIINPSIPGGWEQVNPDQGLGTQSQMDGDLQVLSLRRDDVKVTSSEKATTFISDSNIPIDVNNYIVKEKQYLSVSSSDSGMPEILAESGVCAIGCERVDSDITFVQNTLQSAVTEAEVIKLGEEEFGTLRAGFKSMARTMPALSPDTYFMTLDTEKLINMNEGAGGVYQPGPYIIKENTFNRFWTEPLRRLGGTLYIANSQTSDTTLTKTLTETTLYARTNNMIPAAVTKTLPVPNVLNYQWYKDGKALEGRVTASLYTRQPGIYYCEITGGNLYYGSISSNSVTVYNQSDNLPPKPEVESVGKDYITLKAVTDGKIYEYSINGGMSWQEESVFRNLSQNTRYGIVCRIKDKGDGVPGSASEALLVKTKGDAPDGEVILSAIDYEKEAFFADLLPENIEIYKVKSTYSSYKLEPALAGCLTDYIADFGKEPKKIYAKYSDGDLWTVISIPSRPALPGLYAEDIKTAADGITITGVPKVEYNYSLKAQTPEIANAKIAPETGIVIFEGLLPETEYIIHSRLAASNEDRHFHSSQSTVLVHTLSMGILETQIYIPVGTWIQRTYDLSDVLKTENFVSVSENTGFSGILSVNGKSLSVEGKFEKQENVTVEALLSNQQKIFITIIISGEIVGENEEGSILWMWKQEDTSFAEQAQALIDKSEKLGIGTSRRLIPVYAYGIHAGFRVADHIADTADVTLPYWKDTDNKNQWLLTFLNSQGEVIKIESLACNENGILVKGLSAGTYGLYTIESKYVTIPISVSVNAIYGSSVDIEVKILEHEKEMADNVQWSYSYSHDGGLTFVQEVPKEVGNTYLLKVSMDDKINFFKAEEVVPFAILPYELSVSSADVIPRSYEPGNDIVEISQIILSQDVLKEDQGKVFVVLEGLRGRIGSDNAGTYEEVILMGKPVLAGEKAHNYILNIPQDTVSTNAVISLISAKTEGIMDIRYNQTKAVSYDLESMLHQLPGWLMEDVPIFKIIQENSNKIDAKIIDGSLEVRITDKLTESDVEDIPVLITVQGLRNYSQVTINIQVGIGLKMPVSIDISSVEILDKIYDGKSVIYTGTPEITENIDLVPVPYYTGILADGSIYEESQAPKQAGEYVLSFRISPDNEGYIGLSDKSLSFEIKKRQLTWDLREIKVADRYYEEGSLIPGEITGSIRLSGVIEGDETDFLYDDIKYEFEDDTPAMDKNIKADIKGLTLTGRESMNYQPPESKFYLKGNILMQEEGEDNDSKVSGNEIDGIWATGIYDVEYTGGVHKFDNIQVYDGNTLLTEKTDYTISYRKNKNAYIYSDEDLKAYEEEAARNKKIVGFGDFHSKKAPAVVLKMKGNYTGTRYIYFRILPVDIADNVDFQADNLSVGYTDKKQNPNPTLIWKKTGKKLKKNRDYTINLNTSDSFVGKEGERTKHSFTLVGKGNYTGERQLMLTIGADANEIPMSKVKVTGIKNMTWRPGEGVTQERITVQYRDDILNQSPDNNDTNGDFILTYEDNTAAGKASLLLTGTGIDYDGDGSSYIGTKRIVFQIKGYKMSDVKIEGLRKEYGYTGGEILPDVIGESLGEPLRLTFKTKEGNTIILTKEDYTISYEKNVNKGTAAVIFTGIKERGFEGSKKITFKIASRALSLTGENCFTVSVNNMVSDNNLLSDTFTTVHTKGGAKPDITIHTPEGIQLSEGKDYILSYKNNKKPAFATDTKAPVIIMKGKGNYTGVVEIKFNIIGKNVNLYQDEVSLMAKDKTETNKKNGWKQSFQLIDCDGKKLSKSEYLAKEAIYTIASLPENADKNLYVGLKLEDPAIKLPAGTIVQISVKLQGNYEGEVTGSYRILKSGYDISKAKIKILPREYEGKEIFITGNEQLEIAVLKSKDTTKKLLLTPEEGVGEANIEIISYEKNIKKGTAKVTFRGHPDSDFGGIKTVTFKIVPRSVHKFWKGIFM